VEASSQLHALTAFLLGKLSRFSVGYDAGRAPSSSVDSLEKEKYPSLSEIEAKFVDIPASRGTCYAH